MPILQAVVLGVVQGLTEFIPVSSSAHLVVVPWLFGWPDPGIAFDVALHMGTLAALLSFFAMDWIRLAAAGGRALVARDFSPPDARLALGLVLGSIPAGIAGVLGEKKIDAIFHSDDPVVRARSMLVMAATLAGLAIVLWIAERVAEHRRHLSEVTLVDALVVGCAQALALIPGVSRSGSTLTAGIFRGLDRESAARYSFLLAAPITAGAGAKKGLDLLRGKLSIDDPAAFAVGLVVSAVVGFLCIRLLLGFLRKNTTLVFVVYRVALALVLVGIVLFGLH